MNQANPTLETRHLAMPVAAEHFYRAYGLAIRSELRLPELEVMKPGPADVTVRLVRVRLDSYVDSVRLMSATRTMGRGGGVEWAAAVMGTPANVEILSGRGFDDEALAKATANDLVFAVIADDEAQATAARKEVMSRNAAAMAAYFKRNGTPYRAGELFRQPDLAWTLGQIARRGPDGFYRGPVAERIAASMKAGGGIIDLQDLADYRAIVSEPVWSDYRGYRIAFMPPTSSGVSVAEAMNILENFPVGDLGWGSAAGLHLLAETLKITASDRRLVGGGPDWRTPVKGLVSKAYAAERAKLIRADGVLTAATMPDGNPYPFESADTTHYSVADAEGNAVSNTYTLSASYGAHVVADGTGVLLNNSLGNLAWGDRAKEGSATLPVPGKRVGSTITPLIVFRDGRPWVVTGTPGGGYIVATMVQMLSNVIDHRLNIAEAGQRPRLNQGGGDAPLELESGFSPDLADLLQAKGHKVKPSNTMGSTQSIMVEGDRFRGAADTRRPDALAAGVR